MSPFHDVVRLVAVGDLMLGDSATVVGFGFASRHGDGLKPAALDGLRSLLGEADIVFGNLEVVLSSRSCHRTRLAADQMRGHPRAALDLRKAGFSILNVANNHADQHGKEAFENTITALRGAGILSCGLAGEEPWSSQPTVISTKGREVGFLGYSLRPRQYGSQEKLYAVGVPEEMVRDISRLAVQVDHVVASVHWGEEFVRSCSQGERALAHRLLSAGASIVVGHHPHVLRPIEHTGKTVVAYSLGNFMSDMLWLPSLRRSAVMVCELERDNARVAELRPCTIGNDYLPLPPSQGSPDTENLLVGPGDGLRALSAGAYRDATRSALLDQRKARYGYALRNLHRLPLSVLATLLLVTLRNKVLALFSSSSRS